jgi:hypothetical protein
MVSLAVCGARVYRWCDCGNIPGDRVDGTYYPFDYSNFLFGGGSFYYGPPYHYYGGGFSLILLIILLILLFRRRI